MFDFRLRVFHTVARRLSFTKAGEELFITQPAVTKHIHELESWFKLKLFERNGNKVALTVAGKTLLTQTDRIFELYGQTEIEMAGLTLKQKGRLRIGASTTVGQYVLPRILAAFRQKYPEVRLSLSSENTEEIEQALLAGKIDFGIIEGRVRDQSIHYQPFLKDEIILLSSPLHPLADEKQIRPEELKKIPLLMREPGSGTLEVVHHALKKAGLRPADLKVEMQLNSSESIKSYLRHSPCMAFVSLHAAQTDLDRGEFRRIAVKGLSIERPFLFISARGDTAALPKMFIRFALQDNFR